MQLKNIIDTIYCSTIEQSILDYDIKSICVDSRKVKEQSLFVALEGSQDDGARFIQEAIDRGALVVVRNKNRLRQDTPGADPFPSSVAILEVFDTKEFLRQIINKFYGNPSLDVKTIGITGTNGKTTISYLCESMINAAHFRCGVVGTVNHRIEGITYPSHNTTPGILDNFKFLSELKEKNIDYCIMEVSSHALTQGRVDAIQFKEAVFTNLTFEHLDYHETMEDYFAAKSRLFHDLRPRQVACINIDDPYGRRLVNEIEADVLTFGLKHDADITAKEISMDLKGSRFILSTPFAETIIETSLIGEHNISNILAATAVCVCEQFEIARIKKGIEQLALVPGRCERIDEGQDFHVFIDYAHTDDALKHVLKNLRKIHQGKLTLIFGCGGDRDQNKRPKMGQIASQLADRTILTNDNPRSENPQDIVTRILSGFEGHHYEVILNRREAIQTTLRTMNADEILLIAGKGHEDYQIFRDRREPFDERTIVREMLKEM